MYRCNISRVDVKVNREFWKSVNLSYTHVVSVRRILKNGRLYERRSDLGMWRTKMYDISGVLVKGSPEFFKLKEYMYRIEKAIKVMICKKK